MPTYRLVPKNDLALVNGTTQRATGAVQAKQRIAISLDIFLGEWFLNLKIGMPFFRDVLKHNPNAEVVRSVFRKGIMYTPGITDVQELNVTLDTSARKGFVDFVAIYEDGKAIESGLEFVI